MPIDCDLGTHLQTQRISHRIALWWNNATPMAKFVIVCSLVIWSHLLVCVLDTLRYLFTLVVCRGRHHTSEKGLAWLRLSAFIMTTGPVVAFVVIPMVSTDVTTCSMFQSYTMFFDYTLVPAEMIGFIFYLVIVYFENVILALAVFCFRWPRVKISTASLSSRRISARILPSRTVPPRETLLIAARSWRRSSYYEDETDFLSAFELAPYWAGTSAVVVVTHNSSEKITKTLLRALECVPPCQIFIADNGSTEEETDLCRDICARLSDGYRRANPHYRGTFIHFGCIKEPSKTVAQFAAVYNLCYAHSKSRIKYITLLDDDTLLPDNWSEQVVSDAFDNDKAVKCIAYALSATETPTAVAHFQDFEYKIASFMRHVGGCLGTALFASGAMSTWDLEVLLEVLTLHDTNFDGEDMQLGLLLHILIGRRSFYEQGKEFKGSHRVKLVGLVTKTDIPTHVFHYWDLLPRKYAKQCACGEKSLFYQRVRSWEMSRQFFLGKFFHVIAYLPGFRTWSSFFAKLLCLWEILFIALDWMFIGWLIWFGVFYSTQGLALVICASIMSWAMQLIVLDVFLVKDLIPNRMVVSPVVYVLMPVIYRLPMIVVRICGLMYNVLYYFPFGPHRGVTIKKRVVGADRSMISNLDTWFLLQETPSSSPTASVASGSTM